MVNPTPITSAKTKIKDTVLTALKAFITPGTVAELRVLEAESGNGFTKTYSGYFDNIEAMAEAALKFDGKAPAVYFTLNPCNEALLARAANRVRAIKKEPTTADHDIARRVWFVIDVDPVRPKGISATAEEHSYAITKAGQVREWLSDRGWPDPIAGDSGNGGHLSYRVELPNDQAAADLARQCLEALAEKFSDERATIDRSVFNAARIWKLYGTMARKGDSTKDRPHRRAKLLHVPETMTPVTIEQLTDLASSIVPEQKQQPQTSPTSHEGIDVDQWCSKHGLKISKTMPWKDATKHILNPCPFNSDHAEAAIIKHPSGAVSFECFHDGCRDNDWKKLRDRTEGPRQQPGAAQGQTPPPVTVSNVPVHLLADQAEQILSHSGDQIYQRSGCLVTIVESKSSPKLQFSGGARSVSVAVINQQSLQDRLSRLVRWQRLDNRTGTSRPCDPPKTMLDVLLSRGTWDVPFLTGIIETPTLRIDGSILDKPGYDADTGLFFHPKGKVFPKINPAPTRDEAVKAFKNLCEIFSGFPFEEPHGRSVAMSAVLTALVRNSLRSAPMFAFSAPKMGSGKSLLADVVSLIASGVRCQMFSQPKNEDEEDKILTSCFLAGDRVVCFDNCDRVFKSDTMCIVLTQETWRNRLLGLNKILSFPTNVTFMATGNNLTFAGDISTRVIQCNLDPQCERPEERRFTINLFDHIPNHRGQLVVDAITILRAYHVAGRPDQGIKMFGRFEDWSNLVRSALVWVGESDPCISRQRVEDSDPVRTALKNILSIWYDTFAGRPMQISQVVKEAEMTADQGNDDLLTALADFAGDGKGRVSSRSLGRRLNSFVGRVEGGLKFWKGNKGHGGNFSWSVLQVTQTNPNPPQNEQTNHQTNHANSASETVF
jgi:hypothetical protein